MELTTLIACEVCNNPSCTNPGIHAFELGLVAVALVAGSLLFRRSRKTTA